MCRDIGPESNMRNQFQAKVHSQVKIPKLWVSCYWFDCISHLLGFFFQSHPVLLTKKTPKEDNIHTLSLLWCSPSNVRRYWACVKYDQKPTTNKKVILKSKLPSKYNIHAFSPSPIRCNGKEFKS